MQNNIRSILRKRRQNIPKELKNLHAIGLLKQFLTVTYQVRGKKVASYISTVEEINPSLINDFISLNNAVYYPILHPVISRNLLFSKLNKNTTYNNYNLLEPSLDLNDFVFPWELDIVLVPLVGFNNHKMRVGMGGGFYDTSFAFRNFSNLPLLVGLGFDEQLENNIFSNPWDLAMDCIITPTRIIGLP